MQKYAIAYTCIFRNANYADTDKDKEREKDIDRGRGRGKDTDTESPLLPPLPPLLPLPPLRYKDILFLSYENLPCCIKPYACFIIAEQIRCNILRE